MIHGSSGWKHQAEPGGIQVPFLALPRSGVLGKTWKWDVGTESAVKTFPWQLCPAPAAPAQHPAPWVPAGIPMEAAGLQELGGFQEAEIAEKFHFGGAASFPAPGGLQG